MQKITAILSQKQPISKTLWEETKQRIHEYYTDKNRRAMYPVVDVYNNYFNPGKPESVYCMPCLNRAIGAINNIINSGKEPFFDDPMNFKSYPVYFDTLDFPKEYVVRVFVSNTDGVIAMGGLLLRSTNLGDVTRPLERMGLHPMPPEPGDDPKIVKVYL